MKLLNILCIIFAFITNTLFTSLNAKAVKDSRFDILSKEPHVIVPLGPNCQTSIQLRKNGLYVASFPIDWMVTSNFTSLLELLENDFEDLVNFQMIETRPYHQHIQFYNTKYDIFLTHLVNKNEIKSEFYLEKKRGKKHSPEEWEKKIITKVTNKYMRRIERFKNLNKLNKRVYFTRFDMNERESNELYNLLHKKFPDLDFKILAISYQSNSEKIQPHPHIIYEYLFPRESNIIYGCIFQPKLGKNETIYDLPFKKLFKRLGWLKD